MITSFNLNINKNQIKWMFRIQKNKKLQKTIKTINYIHLLPKDLTM